MLASETDGRWGARPGAGSVRSRSRSRSRRTVDAFDKPGKHRCDAVCQILGDHDLVQRRKFVDLYAIERYDRFLGFPQGDIS